MMLTRVTVVTLRMLVFSATQAVCSCSAMHNNDKVIRHQPLKSYEAMQKVNQKITMLILAVFTNKTMNG